MFVYCIIAQHIRDDYLNKIKTLPNLTLRYWMLYFGPTNLDYHNRSPSATQSIPSQYNYTIIQGTLKLLDSYLPKNTICIREKELNRKVDKWCFFFMLSQEECWLKVLRALQNCFNSKLLSFKNETIEL